MILLVCMRGCVQVPHHFAKFIKLYRENEAEWKPFLTDLGKGSPPVEFLVAFEDGLRYALNVLTLFLTDTLTLTP